MLFILLITACIFQDTAVESAAAKPVACHSLDELKAVTASLVAKLK